MQKQFWQRLLPAFCLALCLAFAGGNALYAADEEQPAPTTGVVIVAVDEQGPAAAAGVVRGDILLTLNGVAVNSMLEFESAWNALTPGEPVTVQVQRGGEVVEYQVAAGDRNGRAYLGLLPYVPANVFVMPTARRTQWLERAGVAPLSAASHAQVIVTGVVTDGVAAAAGLQVDDVILALDGETVARPHSLRTYLAVLEPGDAVVLTVLRGTGEQLEIPVTLAEGKNGRADLGVRLGVKLGAVATSAPMPTMGAEFGSFQAMPAQPGFAAQSEFSVENLPNGVQRLFRFLQPSVTLQNMPMAAPGMMAAPVMMPEQGMMATPEVFVYQQAVPAELATTTQSGMATVTVPATTAAAGATTLGVPSATTMMMPEGSIELRSEVHQEVQQGAAISYY